MSQKRMDFVVALKSEAWRGSMEMELFFCPPHLDDKMVHELSGLGLRLLAVSSQRFFDHRAFD